MNTTTLSQRSQTKIHKIEQREERLLWLTYACYVSVVLLPVGVIINLVEMWRFRHAEGLQREGMVIADSHHHWQARTALVTFLAALVSLGTFYYGVGAVLAVAATVWWIYRLARGMLALSRHAVPVAA